MIPIIDIAPLVNLCGGGSNTSQASSAELETVIKSISDACENYGFFATINHGVDTAIINDAWNVSKEFFDMESSVKQSVKMTDDYPYGYENYESLGRSISDADNTTQHSLSPDSKETFSVGPLNSALSNMPPRKFPLNASSNFAPATALYYSAMENLAKILFRGLAMALKLEDADWFLQEGRFDDGHQCALRILNYPELEYVQKDASAVHIRAGQHTDYGAMTILKSGGPGLQLQLSKDKESSTWIDVPHLEDSFIINLGDLMQRWTNDKWTSTLHRVVATDSNADGRIRDGDEKLFKSARRQSIAFFVNMNGNTTVLPLDTCVDEAHPSKYAPIKASEHLIQRHNQSMMAKNK
mmetsp:Transcript_13687/g.22426  ORF Transcript_13687/g.22426 Transcript_13687/m.22426 type:complete len:354 (+) Transcript_13687:77-1138(+)